MWGLLRVVLLRSCVGDYLLARDVPEFEFECWRNPTILGKSEIQWIYRFTDSFASDSDLPFIA